MMSFFPISLSDCSPLIRSVRNKCSGPQIRHVPAIDPGGLVNLTYLRCADQI